ncbi:NAD(P)/FAD-dependent oxidoreductase [Pseudanabaena sp. UWO310]|uniref:NAD(P)/FAD-dependent oxidoreductase n=1 Tax=Pseudanabaena sp. UWO310 TaxID=2480795 RepID=UPI0011614F53|nr:NAD(P)/FAD-dependent oxidoreductase [Pseudanabaena sp. UWO310]TYQ23246.1 NAD(P)/FAD-dependent oxidoreductase [Pseudanabaena sp. UWO310]
MSNTLDKIAEVPQRLITPETLPTLILGGGFTGLFTALHLSRQHYTTPTILIDRDWSFIFKPLLYEVLSGEMNMQFISHRYDALLHKSGITFIRDNVQSIDLQQRKVSLASGLHYTYSNLVLSLGGVVSYSGVKGAKEYTVPFSTIEDAMTLGKQLRDCLQRATQSETLQQKKILLTFVILGAGRTGVELTATLADLLPDWYDSLGGEISDIRILLIQRGKKILKGDDDHLRQTAEDALHKRSVSVKVMLETTVTEVRPNIIVIKRNDQVEEITAATIIWTTGIVTNPLIDTLSIPEGGRDRQGRLKLTDTLELIDFPEVFAGGDCAVMEHPLPLTAQVAYQQGAAIAHNLQALSEGHSPIAAEIEMRGTLMKLGMNESVAKIFDRYEVQGHLGHLIRQAAYIELLPTLASNFKGTLEWISDELFQRCVGV